MMSKEELFELTSDKVYEAILNGKISLEQFQDWLEEKSFENRRGSYHDGYEDGYYDGAYYSSPQA